MVSNLYRNVLKAKVIIADKAVLNKFNILNKNILLIYFETNNNFSFKNIFHLLEIIVPKVNELVYKFSRYF